MSSDLRDLYQEVILEHGKRPRNFSQLETANRRAEGYNPLCGDRETVFLHLDGDVVRDIAFQGAGCAIFSGVREYPVRIKCATLPWHTMRSALNGEGRTISTEAGVEASPREDPTAISDPPKIC